MAGKMKGKGLDDYVPVHRRIEIFRTDYTEGVIVTERSDLEGNIIAFKAKVFRSVEEATALAAHGLAAATGHAELEVSGEKDVEKCETVAVGRALAILGYEIKKGIASADEMEEAEKEKKPSRRKRRKAEEDDEESNTGGLRKRSNKSSKKEEPEEDNTEEDDESEEEEESSEETEESEKNSSRRSSRRGRRSSTARFR